MIQLYEAYLVVAVVCGVLAIVKCIYMCVEPKLNFIFKI
jgi:hypothetical protein